MTGAYIETAEAIFGDIIMMVPIPPIHPVTLTTKMRMKSRTEKKTMTTRKAKKAKQIRN